MAKSDLNDLESGQGSIISIDNSFYKYKQKRQPFDRDKYREDLRFWIKLSEFVWYLISPGIGEGEPNHY